MSLNTVYFYIKIHVQHLMFVVVHRIQYRDTQLALFRVSSGPQYPWREGYMSANILGDDWASTNQG